MSESEIKMLNTCKSFCDSLDMAKVRKDILSKVIFKPKEQKQGGQTCGVIDTSVHLVSEDTGFEIKISEYRSQIKNKQLALTLFELYLQETIK